MQVPMQVPTSLTNALNALKANGAQGLPSESEILEAPDGTNWTGDKNTPGETWFLVKHNTDSYNAQF